MNTGSALARFTITLSQAVTEPVQVEWFTSDGSAKAGVDYAANKGTVVFAPSETAKTVDILVYGRAVGSEDRSFYVEMLPPTNAILGASIGECIITVDTSGSTPVTQIIVPTGPVGPQGDSAYQSYLDTTTDNPPMTEAEWVESLKGNPAEIAEEVAPLIDVGNTVLTAEGTETLGRPDSTTVKAVARRVAYAGSAKIATLILADGDNTFTEADIVGDAVSFSGAGFYPRIWNGTAFSSPVWQLNENGSITVYGASAGNVLYAVQYDFVSDYNSREAIQSVTEPGYLTKYKSFEKGSDKIVTANDALLWEGATGGVGPYFIWTGVFPKNVPEGSTPASTGGIAKGAWKDVGNASLGAMLSSAEGFRVVGQCASVAALRSIEPLYEGQNIKLASHTAGYSYGGGDFFAVLDGSAYTDNNGTVIKTPGGSAWMRKEKHYAYAVDFGFIVDDATKAASNTTALQKAAEWAYATGTDVWLPMGEKHINSTAINVPVTFRGNTTFFGASLVNRTQKSDVVHHGGGFAFDFTPMVRPTTPASTQPVSDGPGLIGLSIRGNDTDAAAAWRVNTAAVIGNENYARRNFTAMNVQVSGYHAGYGFQMFWMFTNKFHNVVVWDCAVSWYMRSCYSNEHFGSVYENCSYGILAINCFSNDHYGGAIEGIRSMASHTKPSDYDENGNSPLSYDGVGVRVRGGNTNLYGGYYEANRIHYQIENAGRINVDGAYINNTTITERAAHGISGDLRVTHCNIQGDPSVGMWVQASASLKCAYAEIHSNSYVSGTTKPTTVPSISSTGEFDVYDGTIPDANGARRVRLGQDFQVGGYQANSSSPRESYAEVFATRVVNAGNGAADRTVDIGVLSTISGQITALQSSGTLTFTNSNTNLAKEGREITFVINASGTCSLAFGTGFRMVTGTAISLTVGQTAVVTFVSQANKFYQRGSTNILTT